MAHGEATLYNSKQNQVFICQTDQQNSFVVGVATAMKLRDLSFYARNKLACKFAISMSGGSTAGLIASGKLFGSDDFPLANAISINKK
jgi:hypothetical protein